MKKHKVQKSRNGCCEYYVKYCMFVIWLDISSNLFKRGHSRSTFQVEHIASWWFMVFFFSFFTGYCGIFIWVMFPLESMTDGKWVKENPYVQCVGGCFLGTRPFCPRRLSHSWTLAGSYSVAEQGINNIQVSRFLLQALTFVPWIHCVTSGESHKISLMVTFLSCEIQLTQVPIPRVHCEA